MAIILDDPLCFTGAMDTKLTFLEATQVPMKWLGHYVVITGNMDAGVSWGVTVKRIADAGDKPTSARTDLEKLSCNDVTRKGWDNMPDVTDYVKAQPGADRLGYGSPCAINSLVFSQCWLEPKWSVLKAINALLRKAATGKKLPDVPACGA